MERPNGQLTKRSDGPLTERPSPSGTKLIARADRPGLIYAPRVQQISPNEFHIVGRRDDETIVPWGFWGGVLTATVGALVIGYEGVTGLWDFGHLAMAVATLVLGLMLVRFGARSSLTSEPCAVLDMRARTLRLTSSTDAIALPEVPLSELTEIVYGMTTYPVSSAPGAVKVQAFSLLVRHGYDTLLPVIEASPDKEAVYALARFLSGATRLRITQVGMGVQ